jgi:catechol 2,3-dioxygenase-like lactoylglutathione lyase family enzyme
MTHGGMHLGQVATIVVPVTDQAAALAFYVEILGMRKVNDFMYPTGERWLEVSPAKGSSNLCLVVGRPERPAGIETGVVLFSSDVLADLAVLRAQGLVVDDHPLPKGRSGVVERRPARRRPDAVSRPRPRRQLLSNRRRALTPCWGGCSLLAIQRMLKLTGVEEMLVLVDYLDDLVPPPVAH